MKKTYDTYARFVIVFCILICMFLEKGYSQAELNAYEVLNSISTFIPTYNSDSLIRVYKKTLKLEWNQLLKKEVLGRNIYAKVDSSTNLSPFDPIPVAKYLTENDLEYMKENWNDEDFRKWESNGVDFRKFKVIKRKPKIESTKSSAKFKDFVEISPPVYSKDRNIGLIVIYRYCGMECGEGILFVLERKNGIWNHLCQISLWVS